MTTSDYMTWMFFSTIRGLGICRYRKSPPVQANPAPRPSMSCSKSTWSESTSDKPMSTIEIAEVIEVRQEQVEDWLKRGLTEQRIEKLPRPVRDRYRMENSLLQV